MQPRKKLTDSLWVFAMRNGCLDGTARCLCVWIKIKMRVTQANKQTKAKLKFKEKNRKHNGTSDRSGEHACGVAWREWGRLFLFNFFLFKDSDSSPFPAATLLQSSYCAVVFLLEIIWMMTDLA
jgi:hypothetical protein